MGLFTHRTTTVFSFAWAVAAVPLVGACAWTPPLDPDAAVVTNSLSGSVIYSGSAAPSDVIVLLFDAADPPPPAGTGSPVAFSTVSATSFTGAGAGVQAAPWALSQVPDGQWLVTALMDMDDDFQPLLSSNSGATCGDIIGAYLASLQATDLGVVSIKGGVLLDDVTLVLASQLPTERPAFQFATNAVDQIAAAMALSDPSNGDELFTLVSTGIYSDIVQLTGPFDGTDTCDTAFWVHFVDDDQDGVPDPHPDASYAKMGIPFVWPRVYLQYLGDTGADAGDSYVAEAIVDPLMLDQYGGSVPLGVPTPVTQLSVAFVPAAMHLFADGSSETVSAPDLPVGAWSVTVVAETGQTWTLPNEVAEFNSTDDAFNPASQGETLLVQ
ncbi:MAG: hypothetical protein GXP62_11665 [Oligoflexia bacterium]|nr:hypothetical protein [Oligoflexia bacterium]